MRRALPAALLFAGLVLSLSACALDTQLGLDATIGSSSVDVSADPSGSGDVVSVTMDVTYRVGAHAQASHDFTPSGIDVFVDGALVVTIPPDRPAGYVPRLSPGQSVTNTFTGASRPGVAMDPRRLCGAQAHLVFRYTDGTQPGMAEADTSSITCE